MEITVLAIDIGTTRTKTRLYRWREHEAPGPITPVVSSPTAGLFPDGTFDVQRITTEVLRCVREAVQSFSVDCRRVSAVCVTSFLSHVFLDSRGDVLGPGLGWGWKPDPSCIDACTSQTSWTTPATLTTPAGPAPPAPDAREFHLPDRPVSPELLAPRLVHLARHQSDRARQIAAVISLKDWVRGRLTGSTAREDLLVDLSVRDYSLMRDRHDSPIDHVVATLHREGITQVATVLPPAVPAHRPCGTLTQTMAGELALPSGIPVATGATDGTTAMYGGGVLAPDTATLVTGTTDVIMRAFFQDHREDRNEGYSWNSRAGLSYNAAVVPGGYLAGGSTGASGRALLWVDTVLQGTGGWSSIPPGSEGILVAPGFDGERAPWHAPGATGTLAGISLRHTGAHIARAVREAQLYRVRLILEKLTEDHRTVTIVAGGGNRSRELDQLRAAILPAPVRWRCDEELSLCGAAMFAVGAAVSREASTTNDPAEELMHRMAVRAAEDTEPPGEKPPESPRYHELYRRWKRWIAEEYGVER